MVLIDLVKGTPDGMDKKVFPYTATFMQYGKTFHYAIRDRAHLERRFAEIDKTVTCPDKAEIDAMISNFPEVFDDENIPG